MNKRRKLFIDKNFQLAFLGYTSAIALIVAAIYFAANNYFFHKFMQMGREAGLAPEHIFFKFITEQRIMMNYVFALTAILSTLAIVIFGLYMSNRVAGPVRRVQTYLEKHSSGGKSERLHFRKGDFFPDLAKAVNSFAEKTRPS